MRCRQWILKYTIEQINRESKKNFGLQNPKVSIPSLLSKTGRWTKYRYQDSVPIPILLVLMPSPLAKKIENDQNCWVSIPRFLVLIPSPLRTDFWQLFRTQPNQRLELNKPKICFKSTHRYLERVEKDPYLKDWASIKFQINQNKP